MKHFILILSISLFLTGCFGPAKFDATSEVTIKESAKKIADELPETEREEFGKAIMYYSMGGPGGVKAMMGAALTGKNTAAPEAMFAINIKTIDGLSGQEIIEKFRYNLAEDKKKNELERARKEKELAEREAVSKLKDEAKELLKSNKFEEALAKYNAMSEITAGVETAKAGIEETTMAMQEFTEKMNYMDKVEITEFVAKRIDTYSKKDVPAVRISLKNNGERSLDTVKVIVYFHDAAGKVIYEEDFFPVNVSEYSIRNNKPLKAGYVSEMETGKYYILDSRLSEWDEKKTTIKIVDLKFSS